MLAGLVVLGTLLAAVAIARGRFLRQWADADRRIVVTQAANRLLARWFTEPVPHECHFLPKDRSKSTGLCLADNHRAGRYRDALDSIIVRLQVFDHRAVSTTVITGTRLCWTVDVLVHKAATPRIPTGCRGGSGAPP